MILVTTVAKLSPGFVKSETVHDKTFTSCPKSASTALTTASFVMRLLGVRFFSTPLSVRTEKN